MKRKSYLLFGFTFMLGLLLFAQNPKPDTLITRPIGQEYGLSQLNALTIDFDSDGYLWIGTENGLNRFNAFEIKTFLSEEGEDRLIDDHIRAMVFQQDTLWLATNTHTMAAYLPREDRFLNFDDQIDYTQFPKTKFANTLHAVNQRYLLVGVNGSILLFDKKTYEFTIIPLSENASEDFVSTVIPFGKNKFLIGTNAHGLFQFDLEKKKLSRNPIFQTWDNAKILALYPYTDETILISESSGLYEFNFNTQKSQLLYATQGKAQTITKILPWGERQVFLSLFNHAYLMSKDRQLQKLSFVDLNNELIEVEVTDLKTDEVGGKWLATKGRGVLYYHPNLKKFKPYRIQAKNAPRQDYISIFNFLREENQVWMATEFGFARYDFEAHAYQFFPRPYLEYTLAKDANGTLWGGGFGQGLVRYNPEIDDFETVNLDLPDRDVIQITPIDKNEIWVHTWTAGIFSVNLSSMQVQEEIFPEIHFARTRTSFKDSDGNIWLGNDDGIFKLKEGKIQRLPQLSNPRVFSIAEDSQKNIWVGTAKGLNKIAYKTDKVTFYQKQNGLPNDFIYGVEVDQNDQVWAATNYGLSKFNPIKEEFQNYTEADGLQNNEFNGKASYQDNNGNLYFGGMNGFNLFHPDSVFVNQKVGKTLIEKVLLLGEEPLYVPSLGQKLELPSQKNVVSFQYTSLNYLWPEKNLFQFKLEGFDEDWRPITKERITTYTNLDPGTYVFKVKGSNDELVWGEADELKIVIQPPWFKTWWFNLVILLILGLTIISFYLYKIKKEKSTNRRLAKMVDERTEELHTSNVALQESLEISEKQKESITFLMRELNHRVKNNLQIIISLIDLQDLNLTDPTAKEKMQMLQTRIFTVSHIHDILNHVREKEHVRLDEFLRELAKEILAFSGSDIHLALNLQPTETQISKLTYAGLILNELITNSVKHAFPDKDAQNIISLKLESNPDEVVVYYRDNGVGFDPEKVDDENKLGMNLIRFLIKELNGTFEMQKEKGTLFKLTFKRERPYDGN